MRILSQILIVLVLLASCKSRNKSGSQQAGSVQTENKTTTKQESQVLTDKSDMVLFDAANFPWGETTVYPKKARLIP
jgi:hypothetical protein